VPRHGLYLDLPQRSGAVWTVGGSSGTLETIAEQWPGWSWDNWDERTSAIGRGADPGSGPRLAEAFQQLSESFERHQLLDAGTEAAAVLLRAADWIQGLGHAAGLTFTPVEDNAFTHRPVELSAAELADTREAIAAAALRMLP
jgi:hypothetical protein